MSKLDNIFEKVISDPIIAEKYNISAGRYSTIGQGSHAMNPYVKYIARVLSDIDKEVDDVKEKMHHQYQSDSVKLANEQLKAIYKVSLPIINTKDDEN